MKEKDRYLDPSYMVSYLDRKFGRTFQSLKRLIKDSDIVLSEDEIKDFIDKENNKEEYKNNYFFNSKILKFYKKYLEILKEKCLHLLKIVENIAKNNLKEIESEIESLDITINNKGQILEKDAIRLLIPILYNTNLFFRKLCEANNPKSYIKENVILQKLESNEISEEDVYPDIALQNFNLYVFDEGFVPLSDKQENELLSKENK